MRRIPSPLLALFQFNTRRALSSSSARWTARLERVGPLVPSPQPIQSKSSAAKLPFRFETGIALFAKRTPRPFPPPFLSPPSGSFSDPLSTHRKIFVNSEPIQGYTNGDDAVFASDNFIAVNDGVGAWSTRPRGHAGLWSRLIVHFWALEALKQLETYEHTGSSDFEPHPVTSLQTAYEKTVEATSEPNNWHGTTTATGAHLSYKSCSKEGDRRIPLVYVTNLGDSQVMILRPQSKDVIYKSTEQWHWFDCPRQLGTNSPDTPVQNAVMDVVEIQEGDVVVAMSDGVIDNLWEHEIVENIAMSMRKWEQGNAQVVGMDANSPGGEMQFVAEQLMTAAKVIALDPFAESPFMEHAIEEGLPSHGGKLDDISVVAAICQTND